MILTAESLDDIKHFNLWQENSDNEWTMIATMELQAFFDFLDKYHPDQRWPGMEERAQHWLWTNHCFIIGPFILGLPNWLPEENGY